MLDDLVSLINEGNPEDGGPAKVSKFSVKDISGIVSPGDDIENIVSKSACITLNSQKMTFREYSSFVRFNQLVILSLILKLII